MTWRKRLFDYGVLAIVAIVVGYILYRGLVS
jgi:hypothetical protein